MPAATAQPAISARAHVRACIPAAIMIPDCPSEVRRI
jgi:hypothetical protein